MIERPIPFKAPMVRALLDGTKTQTRRAVKLPHMNPLGEWEAIPWGGPNGGRTSRGEILPAQIAIGHSRTGDILLCPYGQPSDRLWVRETFVQGWPYDPVTDCIQQFDADGKKMPVKTWYRADGADIGWSDEDGWEINTPWKQSIHMPRAASRITLEITTVRVERLHDISESDCGAEGIEEVMYDFDDAVQAQMAKRLGCCIEDVKPLYALWWEREHGPGSWAANPWVWAIKFKRIDKAGAP